MKIDTNLLVMVGIALLAFIAFKSQGQSQSQPSVIVMPQPQAQAGDDRYSRAPRPQRFWDNGPEVPLRGGLHSALDPIATVDNAHLLIRFRGTAGGDRIQRTV